MDKLWTPRLRPYEDDRAVFSEEPFSGVFAQLELHTQTRRGGVEITAPIMKLLSQSIWRQHLSDWLIFTLGGVLLTPKEGVYDGRQLFIDVLGIRRAYGGGDEGEILAVNMLLSCQMENYRAGCFHPFDSAPAEFCWQDDLAQRELLDDDSDTEEKARDSESEGKDGLDPTDSGDTDYIPMDEELDFVPHERSKRRVILPQKDKNTVQPVDAGDLPAFYAQHIRDFFFSTNTSEDRTFLSTCVRQDLVQMRALRPAQYRSGPFQSALETSGLFDLLREVCRAGNLLEVSHRDVTDSFRRHNWKIAYAELICRWVKPTLTEAEYEMPEKPDPLYKFSADEARSLLGFMSINPALLPWSFNPMAVYMFLSLHCFRDNCELWLVPTLRTLRYPRVQGWNSEVVYRALTSLPEFRNSQSPTSFLVSLDRRLACVIQETVRHNTTVDRVKHEVWRTAGPRPCPAGDRVDSDATAHASSDASDLSDAEQTRPALRPTLSAGQARKAKSRKSRVGGAGAQAKAELLGTPSKQPHLHKLPGDPTDHHRCPHCAELPMQQQCVRIIYVSDQKPPVNLHGAALTCWKGTDRLKPKPPLKSRKGVKKPPVRYLHPFEDLKMTTVRHRRSTYRRCRKDIQIFMWRRDGHADEFVGGVRFKAYSRKTLHERITNQRRLVLRAIHRRDILERFGYGKMSGGGSRQPSGGYEGDIYGPYAIHSGETPDDIAALFRQGTDNDTLIEVATTIYSPMRRQIQQVTAESGLNRFGSYGVSTFTCDNYISSIHEDFDSGLEDHGGQYPWFLMDVTPTGQ
ncbi:hypothetical protein GGX14DRAFT_554355 [Mycena pura]|uniref:Uncharacterized protein n=1 Tax=Mycena pura TaxID=153505 RepID=A0AAD7E4D5_9AGAR|nr:hypothetical protein GGX14DRAFT_554355 [Mycena pura]